MLKHGTIKMTDSKIYLMTYDENGKRFVSHGVGDETLKNYVLPQEPLSEFRPFYQDDNGYYIEAT